MTENQNVRPPAPPPGGSNQGAPNVSQETRKDQSTIYREGDVLEAKNQLGASLSSTNVPQMPTRQPEQWQPNNEDADKVKAVSALLSNRTTGGAYRGKNFYGSPRVKFRRIAMSNFRLGMERQPEKFVMLPGTVYRWEPNCTASGIYKTGLEDDPELRKELERLTGFDLSPTSNFYADLSYKLEEKTGGFVMNLEDSQIGLYNQIVLFAMLAGELVAASYEEAKSTKYTADWYIEDKEKEAIAKIAVQERERKAMDLYDSMTMERRAGVAKVLQLSVIGLTDRAAASELWDYIKGLIKDVKSNAVAADPKTNVENFIRIAEMDNESLIMHSTVVEATNMNILRRNSRRELTYNDIVFGMSEAIVVDTLRRPENQALYLQIQKEVEAKKRM